MAKKSKPKSRAKLPARPRDRIKRRKPVAKRGSKLRTPLFRAYLAVTLDGYIADKGGGVDFSTTTCRQKSTSTGS